MSEDRAIRVDFGKPMPLFPFPKVELLPQQVLPLHIFEPRYRQMIEDQLSAAGQFAVAVFEGDDWKENYHGRPALKPMVCIGQIVQHDKLADGRFNLLVQGICRARIIEESEPDQVRLYRQAMLEPTGLDHIPGAPLDTVRQRVESLLSGPELKQMAVTDSLMQFVESDDVSTAAMLELVSFALITNEGLKYRLLAETDVMERAKLIVGELEHIQSLIRRAELQRPQDWPKGLSLN